MYPLQLLNTILVYIYKYAQYIGQQTVYMSIWSSSMHMALNHFSLWSRIIYNYKWRSYELFNRKIRQNFIDKPAKTLFGMLIYAISGNLCFNYVSVSNLENKYSLDAFEIMII